VECLSSIKRSAISVSKKKKKKIHHKMVYGEPVLETDLSCSVITVDIQQLILKGIIIIIKKTFILAKKTLHAFTALKNNRPEFVVIFTSVVTQMPLLPAHRLTQTEKNGHSNIFTQNKGK